MSTPIIVLYQHYRKNKLHRGTIEDDQTMTFQCNTWSPIRNGDPWSNWYRARMKIAARNDEEIVVHEGQLCGNCFPKKRRPKVRVSPNSSGRIIV